MTDHDFPESNDQFAGEFEHSPVTARVPEHVANGVFANGVVVLAGPHEIVCDFVLRLMPPHRIVGRVVFPFSVAHQFVIALKQNLEMYQSNFGTIPAIPTPQSMDLPTNSNDLPLENPPKSSHKINPAPRSSSSPHPMTPNINEVYEEMKINEPELGGHYCNAVLIRHTPTEFFFDFIANIYPKSIVTLRLIMPVPHITSFYNSLHGALQQRRPQ